MNETVSKRQLVDKADQRMLIAAGVGAFIVIFCLVAAQALFSQMLYQNRVASAKKATLKQLNVNVAAVDTLEQSYKTFVGTSPNLIGGSANGTGSQDGDNAKIILDSLPSAYDFPALASSLEKMMNTDSVHIDSIGGTDDEVAQSSAAGTGSPQPVAVPFQFTASGSYDAIRQLASHLEASIRPIQVQTMTITSTGNNGLSLSVTAQTYYQPAKVFSIGSETIK
jgi:Tfp pilus assembly protein PilO